MIIRMKMAKPNRFTLKVDRSKMKLEDDDNQNENGETE